MAAAMDRSDTLSRLAATIASRRGADPSTSWVAKLHARGVPVIARKLGERTILGIAQIAQHFGVMLAGQ